MKKASDILLIVGLVFSIFAIIAEIAGIVGCFNLSSSEYTQRIIDAIDAGRIKTNFPGNSAEQAVKVQSTLLTAAWILIGTAILLFTRIVLLILSRYQEKLGIYVACLVLSIIPSFDIFCILGNIFAIVSLPKKNKPEVISE